MASVHLLSVAAQSDAPWAYAFDDLNRMRRSATADRFGVHRLTDDPADADVILFVENCDPGRHYLEVRRHPVYRAHHDRCFLFSRHDFPIPFLPGIYASINRRWHDPERTRSGFYLDVFDKIYDQLGGGEYTHEGEQYQGKGNDVFYLFTFADVAIPSFQDEHEEVAQPATDRPEKFRTHVLEKFIPKYDATKYMGGLYAGSSSYAGVPEYEPDNARMVNFDVRESKSETESSPELEDQERPVLHGTKELLDRLGRRWR